MVDASFEENYPMADEVLPLGTTLSGEHFTITGHLGAGGFGITYRAKDNVLGRTIVIKECFPGEFCVRRGLNAVPRSQSHADPMLSIVRMFMHEARSLAKLRHPNIVGVHRAFEENQTAYMALDLIEGPDLFDILEVTDTRLPSKHVHEILFQMLNAIEKVHDIGLLHRDISPDNILIEEDGTPVLIDFGAARADPTRHTRAASSLLVVKDGYSPQEFYVPGREQTPSSDLYALAATFYHVLSGEPPPDSQARMLEIAGNRPDPCVPLTGRIPGYDDAFLQAIDKAMEIHPGDRLQSAAEWRSMIAKSAPEAETDTTGAEIPLQLETLARLVEETNDEVRRTSQLVKQPDPEPVVLPKKAASRPEWVEEFNEEALASDPTSVSADAFDAAFQDLEEETDAPEPSAEAVSAPAEQRPSETNWVDRAKLKEQRSRLSHLETSDAEAAADDAPTEQIILAKNPYDWNEYAEPSDNSWSGKAKVAGVFMCLFLSIYTVATFEMDEGPASSTPTQSSTSPRVNSLEMNGSIIP
jgi:serine/threonine protein kinase